MALDARELDRDSCAWMVVCHSVLWHERDGVGVGVTGPLDQMSGTLGVPGQPLCFRTFPESAFLIPWDEQWEAGKAPAQLDAESP